MMNVLKLFPLLLLSGCATLQQGGMPQSTEVESPSAESSSVISDSTLPALIEVQEVIVPECTQPVTVVSYREECELCGDYPVSVRTHGLSRQCQ